MPGVGTAEVGNGGRWSGYKEADVSRKGSVWSQDTHTHTREKPHWKSQGWLHTCKLYQILLYTRGWHNLCALLGTCRAVTLVPNISKVQVAVGSMQEPSHGFCTLAAERMNALDCRGILG